MPVSPITASVGLGGVNKKSDVEIVQRLLNACPFIKGGPNPLLKIDGLCGPNTRNGISRFQQVNFGKADGKVDPGYQTIGKMIAIVEQAGLLAQTLGGIPGSGPTPPSAPGPSTPGASGGVSALRADILKWAKLGVSGPYGDVGGGAQYGIVSDWDTMEETLSWGGKRTVRRGWKNYKEFFDVAVAGWTANHWLAPGYLDGVKIPGKRVPIAPGVDKWVSWCGIFATWCWIKAGKDTKWVAGLGPTKCTKVAGNQGIQPGDMCVQYGAEVHHFLAVGVNGGNVDSINGNSMAQSIIAKPHPLSSVNYYYRPD